MGDAAGMEGSSLAKIFVGGLDRSVDEVILWFTCSLFQENSLWREEQKIYAQIQHFPRKDESDPINNHISLLQQGVVRNFFSQFGPVLEVCTNRIFIFFHKSVCSLPPMFSSEQELTI